MTLSNRVSQPMSHAEKIQHLLIRLKHKSFPNTTELTIEMGCSRMQLNRLIRKVERIYGYNIDYNAHREGYEITHTPFSEPNLSPERIGKVIQLLVLLQDLRLEKLNPAFKTKALADYLQKGMEKNATSNNVPAIQFIPANSRTVDSKVLQRIYNALAKQQQLFIEYIDGENNATQRCVSVQQLLNYRNNWYIDAFCHMRNDWRVFAVERVKELKGSRRKAQLPVLSEQQYQNRVSSFGIFSGEASNTAVLLFSPHVAHWVCFERWHSKQIGRQLADGSYQLMIPYHISIELESEILRFGEHVTVLEPESLRKRIRDRIQRALKNHT